MATPDLDQQIADLRGRRKLSYAAIGAELGISSATARKHWLRMLPPPLTPEELVQAREAEREPLDTAEQKAWEGLERIEQTISYVRAGIAATLTVDGVRKNTDEVDWDTMNSLVDRLTKLENQGTAKLSTVIRASERRSRLFGLDAPQQVHVAGLQPPNLDASLALMLESVEPLLQLPNAAEIVEVSEASS